MHVPHTEYDKVPELYGIANCLVLPSLEEVWGLVINEAMAAGLPIISSDRVGASEDLVTDDVTGYIYPAGNTDALVMNMTKILKNSRRLGMAATSLVKKTHPATMAKKHFGATRYAK